MSNVSFSIADEDYTEFENAFLKENPVPLDSILTPIGWIEEWGRQQYLRAIERGKIKLAQESVVTNDGILWYVFSRIKT